MLWDWAKKWLFHFSSNSFLREKGSLVLWYFDYTFIMNSLYTSSDTLVHVDQTTECRIGIGEKYGGVWTEWMQIRYRNWHTKNIPYYSLLGSYIKWANNVVFSDEIEFLAKSLSFSNKDIFDLFCRSSHTSTIQASSFWDRLNLMNWKSVEYLPEINEDGWFTGHLIEQNVAHEEGIGHISTHFWAINRNAFRVQNDVGIYLPFRTKSGYWSENFCLWSLGGWDIGVSVNLYRINRGDTVKEANFEWEIRAQSKVHPGLREYLSVATVLWKIRDEVGLLLESTEKDFPRIWESWKIDFHSLTPKIPKLHCVLFNAPYSALWKEEENGKTKIVDHDGRIDMYVFEHDGEIPKFDESKIQNIKLLPSREIRELLDTRPELFGGNNDGSWKTTAEYKLIERILDEIQGRFL